MDLQPVLEENGKQIIQHLQPVLEENEKQIIQHIMGELHYVIPTRPSSIRSHTNSTGSSGTQGGAIPNTQGGRAIRSRSRTDRLPGGDEGGNDDGNDDGDEEGEQRPKLSSGANSLLAPKFACPFFKRDPAKYQNFPGCPGPGWVSVHRLK